MKDLILFFPWNKQHVSVFRQEKPSDADIVKIINYVTMADEVLKDMKFEDAQESGEIVTEYITEEMWQVIENKNIVLGEDSPRNPNWKIAESLKMLCPTNSKCRGWLIDAKKLSFFRLNEYAFTVFKGKTNVVKSFDDIEKFVEDYKHRFASKKFGL